MDIEAFGYCVQPSCQTPSCATGCRATTAFQGHWHRLDNFESERGWTLDKNLKHINVSNSRTPQGEEEDVDGEPLEECEGERGESEIATDDEPLLEAQNKLGDGEALKAPVSGTCF